MKDKNRVENMLFGWIEIKNKRNETISFRLFRKVKKIVERNNKLHKDIFILVKKFNFLMLFS